MTQVQFWDFAVVMRVEEMKTSLGKWVDEVLEEEPGNCLCLNRKHHCVNQFACVTVALRSPDAQVLLFQHR